MKKFRRDTDFANTVFCDFKEKLKTPLSILMSKNDMFTKNYIQADELWGKYFHTIKSICYINSESHYFQRTNAEELIAILNNT